MKKILRILGILVLSIIILLLILVAYIKIALPNVGPAPEMTIEKTEARIQRGNYLAKSVMACMDCHSKRDLTQFTMPLVPSTLGQGGERFDQTMGFPGVFSFRSTLDRPVTRSTSLRPTRSWRISSS